MAQTATSGRRKSAKKVKRVLSSGQVHIFATFNNTIVTVTDTQGNAVTSASAGASGFKGSRKSTPLQPVAAEQAIKNARRHGHPGSRDLCQRSWPRRENAIRAVQASGLRVTSITDITLSHTMDAGRPRNRALKLITQ
jgi:small subunit ribosomal protein S11